MLSILSKIIAHNIIFSGARKVLTRRRRVRSRPVGQAVQKLQRVFVDVSVIYEHDAGTGIQRVVRALSLGLCAQATTLDFELHFVAAGRDTPYHTIPWPHDSEAYDSITIDGRPGDVFIGLDYSLDAIRWNANQLACFRRNGGRLWFLVHDLLPLENPEWFSRYTVLRYRAWFDILATVADGFLCNSLQTESQLRNSLQRLHGLEGGYLTKVLPMGYQFENGSQVQRPTSDRLASFLRRRPAPYFLQVGTLEPRKGHSDVLDAFDILWAAGFGGALVFVGKKGWKMDNLYFRINSHPLLGRMLFWFDDVNDAQLNRMYRECKGLIIASLAEGFGLPLIEALGHRTPVLARDLKVFRQHEACGVEYFPRFCEPSILAQKIKGWSDGIDEDRISIKLPKKGWKESVFELIEAVR